MKPAIGNYSLFFGPSVTPDTPYYPLNGKGSFTTDEDLSFVRKTEESLITAGSRGYNSASSSHEYSIFHGDGTLAWFYAQNTTNPEDFHIGLPADGLRVTGNWYVQCNLATPLINFAFKVLS